MIFYFIFLQTLNPKNQRCLPDGFSMKIRIIVIFLSLRVVVFFTDCSWRRMSWLLHLQPHGSLSKRVQPYDFPSAQSVQKREGTLKLLKGRWGKLILLRGKMGKAGRVPMEVWCGPLRIGGRVIWG